MAMDPKATIMSLTMTGVRGLEAAVVECVNRRHYEVRVEHWLLGLLRDAESDVATLFADGETRANATRTLERHLAGVREGNSGKPVFSLDLLRCIDDAMTEVSVPRDDRRVRSGAVLARLVAQPKLYRHVELVAELLSLADSLEDLGEGGFPATKEEQEAKSPPPPRRLPRETLDHVAIAGETLLDIARGFAVDVEDVARLNGIGIHDELAAGSTIKVSVLLRDIVPR
jgi:ATP-dependent Clp protease ATP-binding subunit ClpA